MRKSLLTLGMAGFAGLTLVAGTGLANASTHAAALNTVPYTWSGSDNGTCQNTWAQDLGTRVFSQPAPSAPGLYQIKESFTQGHFSTFAGMSPGACGATGGGTFQTPPGNGHQVREGLSGTMTGYEYMIIQNGSFTAGDGTCAGAGNPCTTAGYVAAHYGNAATYSITTWAFVYRTTATDALGKFFKEQGNPQIFNGAEVDTGDIYTS